MTVLTDSEPQPGAHHGADPTDPSTPAGARDLALRRRSFLRTNVTGVRIAALILVALTLMAIFAGLVAPHSPIDQNLAMSLKGRSSDHFLGTDRFGRDVFSRLIYAARPSLIAALQAVLIAGGIGIPFGLAAGYFGGRRDLIISWLNDVVMGFPPLILAIAIVGVLGPGLRNAMLAVGIVLIPRFLRLSRGVAIDLRNEPFIEAAKATGCSDWSILVRHVLPNAAPALLVEVSLLSATAMLAEAGLSFLGLGVVPPEPSWGNMLAEGFAEIRRVPMQIVYPGMAITITVLCLFAIGEHGRQRLSRSGGAGGF